MIFIILFIAWSIAAPYFLTERNLQQLGIQSSIVAALAIGELLVIIAREIDVSVSSVLALSGVLPAELFGAHHGFLFIVVLLAVGLGAGMLNGALVVGGRITQALIVTVATLGIVEGISLLVSHGEEVVGLPPALNTVGSGFVGPIPVPVLIVAGVAILAYVFVAKTRWGRWIYAIGADPEAARWLGIPVGRVRFSAYALCGVGAAVAGLLLAGQTNAAVPGADTSYLLDSITAVVIGGASLQGGRGSVGGAVVGALILATVSNGLDLLNVQPYWYEIAVGCIIVIALELDVLRGRLENRLRVLHSHDHEGGGA